MKKHLSRRMFGNASYTLVEISVALLVLAIGFSALLAVFPVGLKWAKETTTNNTAAHVAQAIVAEYTFTTPALIPAESDPAHDGPRGGYYWAIAGYKDGGVATGSLMHIYVSCYANMRERGDGSAPTGTPLARFKQLKYIP